ncbi:porin family protein [Oceanihabitans sp. 2_MG-2023]|uniref:porin family protein n=1 Tax=Oceanihabitans sp. 2_MG-2023 TaxID=3062661 RepID=UPI0026E42C2D|nr:porin family protein [Oceanihabitans sp. 2_MG-2023]MDO6597527.1 porin family protein [Oceanihabitans sp. 2_MG-2023]
MRKLCIAAIAVFGLSFGLQAQEVSFGAKAGVNLASIDGDSNNTDMKVGFHVGGVAEIMFNDKLGVQPEILYSSQGGKEDIGDDNFKYNFDYINVPVMVKYFVIEGLSVETGPQVGYLVNAKAKNDSDSIDLDNIKDIDFGINFGAGYKMDSGILFSVRYNLGIININDGGNDVKNKVIQFSVGYMF